MKRQPRQGRLLAALGFCTLSACRPESLSPPARAAEGALKVTDIQLGRAVGRDKRVLSPTDSFSAQDTIYASVVTEGTSERTSLKARWVGQAVPLAETAQAIAPTGLAVSEFHVWKPQGWPPGDYRVEIFVNDVPAGSRAFSVR